MKLKAGQMIQKSTKPPLPKLNRDTVPKQAVFASALLARIGLTRADGGARVAYYFQGRIARLDALLPGKTERLPFDVDLPLSGPTR
ncbi:hypothetical protein [Achromobacter insuavis]|uniref:hypothetical protein n=1 Tax=Achromobacter insuavis TaxID=1287735 RepID=UPI0015D2306C|nr:hypothetical protein [Achromobacter insuavis]